MHDAQSSKHVGPFFHVVQGPGVILTGRKLLGATNPNDAAVGTIRGDFCLSVGRNALHGSDGPDSAKHEISMWFKVRTFSFASSHECFPRSHFVFASAAARGGVHL